MNAESIFAEATSCLHCLMSADAESVQACLAHCASGDSLILLNAAVNILLNPDWSQALDTRVAVYVLAADVSARGLPQESIKWECIDDSAWVELCKRHRHCLSWK